MKILIDTKKSTLDEEIWKSRGKAIAFTVAPFGIPLILSLVPDSQINSLGKMVIVILLFVIDTYWVMKITVRDSGPGVIKVRGDGLISLNFILKCLPFYYKTCHSGPLLQNSPKEK